MNEALSPTSAAAPGRRFNWRSEWTLAGVTAVLFASLPIVLSGYPIYILPEYMIYSVLAMSLGMLWGFTGILSFGHAAFFALGAYTMGLAMKWGVGPNPGYIALLVSILIGGGGAALVGYFLFSAGVRDIYFVLVTLALSIMVQQITISQSQITGGFNGMFVPRMDLTFGSFGKISLADDIAVYYAILPVVAMVYCLLRWIIASSFGKVLVGIRENEDRALSLGFSTSFYKTAAFAISGAVAGGAGALYGSHAEFVSPSLASVQFSTEIVIWVAIGGRQSLLGALLGGIAVASLSNYLNAITPVYWQLVLGLVFIAVIVAFKGGAAGVVQRLAAKRAGADE